MTGRLIARAPITPILELGVGWNPELDAIDNIYLLGSVMGMSLPEIRAAVDEILAFAELERFANLKLQHYSSGMASRLAYAVAFKAVREVLVLDEDLRGRRRRLQGPMRGPVSDTECRRTYRHHREPRSADCRNVLPSCPVARPRSRRA